MKAPSGNVHELIFCCATYDTTGLPLELFVPYQMLNCLPLIVTVPFGMVAPMGWLSLGL